MKLEAKSLYCKRGNSEIFSNLSFKINSGEALIIRGGNGSGKSTLLRTICGLSPISDGDILLDDKSFKSEELQIKNNILFISHSKCLTDDFTSFENLNYLSLIANNKIENKEIREALNKFSLEKYSNAKVKSLSEGTKKKISLCRLITVKRKLILLDEPYSSLDKAAINILNNLIKEKLEQKVIVMITTHQDFSDKNIFNTNTLNMEDFNVRSN